MDPILRAQLTVLRGTFTAGDPMGRCVHAAVDAAEAADLPDPLAAPRLTVEKLARELVEAVRETGNPALRRRGPAQIARELELAFVTLDAAAARVERERGAA
jgi:hypothetical protein